MGRERNGWCWAGPGWRVPVGLCLRHHRRALTIPLKVVMLLGLIFRGVAFEFRFKATEVASRVLG